MKCEKLLNTIRELNDEYLDVLEDVCNIESPTDFKEGVDAVGTYFAERAKRKGWKVEIFRQNVAGDVVCITLNPDAAAAPISISGHIDTVHPVGLFGKPAVKRDGTRMYGPGVADCKGGVVAGFMAMDALEKCGFTARPVRLLIQTDEEKGSSISNKETIKYICAKSLGSVAFLNLECGTKGFAVLSRKGILRYSFTVHGKACHSSRCNEGANAVREAAYKIIALEEMKDPAGLTCNCGVINGGSVANTVAEECRFTADIRFATEEQAEEARRRVNEIAQKTVVEGCSCTVEELSYRPMMEKAKRNYDLLDKMNEIYEENGLSVLKPIDALGGSDAAYATEYGIPCVDSVGAEGGKIHSSGEYIEMSSISESAGRIATVIYCI